MDNTFNLISIISFLIISLLVGIVIIWMVVTLVTSVFLKKKYETLTSENNIASSILVVAVVFSTAYLCSNVFMTIQQNFHLAAQLSAEERSPYVWKVVGVGTTQVILSIFMTLIIAYVSTKLFDLMTKNIMEYQEITEKNNIAVGLMMAGIVIGLSIFVQYPLSALVSTIIPMPEYIIPK